MGLRTITLETRFGRILTRDFRYMNRSSKPPFPGPPFQAYPTSHKGLSKIFAPKCCQNKRSKMGHCEYGSCERVSQRELKVRSFFEEMNKA